MHAVRSERDKKRGMRMDDENFMMVC